LSGWADFKTINQKSINQKSINLKQLKMKKLTFLMICFLGISMMANAVGPYFVDFSKADDTGDGQSWETAKKTIAGAVATSGESVYVKSGTYAQSATALVFTAGVNYYGSCDAANTGTATTRSLSDLDGNGVVEPWEFTNATLLTTTFANNSSQAFTLAGNVDGFVFKHTWTAGTGMTRTFGGQSATSTFKNNTLRNCELSLKATSGFFGPVLNISGIASDCLVENNKLTVTTTVDFNNGTSRGLIRVSGAGAKASNFVVRNNSVNYNFATVSGSMTSNSNIGGAIVSLAQAGNAVVKNFVVNNNEVNYTGSYLPTRGGLFSYFATAAGVSTDSILNCTVANNKTTNFNCAGIAYVSSNSTYVFQAYNNVAYNNYNTLSSTSTTSLANMYNERSVSTGGLISNNYTNGAGLTNATRVTNNDNTQTAIDNTIFKFINPTDYQGLPTAYAGNPVGQTAVSSLWSLTSGSYLTAKGLTSSNKYDKAANLYTTIPSVGAYENTTQTFTTTLSIGANGGISGYTDAQVVTSGYAAQVAYTIAPNSNFKVLSLLYNGVESKASIVSGVFTAPALIGNATLAVTFDINTGLDYASDNVRLMGSKNLLQVEGLKQGDMISIYNLAGAKLATKTMAGSSASFSLNSGIYLVKINNKVNKVLVN
jgi:hypothetical protein